MTNRLPFDRCSNIDDVLKLVLDNIDNLPPNRTAAAWNYMSRLLSKKPRNHHNHGQRERQLQLFLQHTMSMSAELNARDLTTIVFAMAKIQQNIRNAQKRRNAWKFIPKIKPVRPFCEGCRQNIEDV
jgi:hypothetical protein